MVNIQSVICINDDLVISYNSYASFWAAITGNMTPEQREHQSKIAQQHAIAEGALARRYNIPEAWAQHVTFIFATLSEARRRLADEYTRRLVCDPQHRLVVQVRSTKKKFIMTTTVYRPHDHEIISAICDKDDPQTPPTRHPSLEY